MGSTSPEWQQASAGFQVWVCSSGQKVRYRCCISERRRRMQCRGAAAICKADLQAGCSCCTQRRHRAVCGGQSSQQLQRTAHGQCDSLGPLMCLFRLSRRAGGMLWPCRRASSWAGSWPARHVRSNARHLCCRHARRRRRSGRHQLMPFDEEPAHMVSSGHNEIQVDGQPRMGQGCSHLA